MFKKLKNWLINKLGGFTVSDALALMGSAGEIAVTEYQRGHATNLVTEENVITAAKAIRELGKAVYPYASHFIAPDGVYIASVEVMKGETE